MNAQLAEGGARRAAALDFEAALNPEQLATVRAPDGPIFVLAAAGTGKTRTLVYRVAWLAERGVDARRILLLTFTNKAAHEMLERATALVGPGVSGIWGGTFHHMANRMLRRYADRLGYAFDFTILDRDDAAGLLRNVLDELKLRSKEFPKPDVLLAVFSGAINRRRPVAEAVAERFENHPVDVDGILRVFQTYEKKKRRLNAMDFDDLLIHSLALLREQPDVLQRYQEQFLYILVDEYQDTNPIQADWVDLLAARHRNLLVVGDDFQSIYAWRGADYRHILTFPQRYPDATHFKLETNYRSVPEILEVANACIAGNPHQFQKTLRPTRPPYRLPVWAVVRDGDRQAYYVARKIRELRREGYGWREMAVLYRAHYHAMEAQLALTREQIPFQVTSGVRFFEQAHVKDVCSLLRLLHNPGDEMAFVRVLGLLPGIGPRTTVRLWQTLGGRFDAREAAQRGALLARLPSGVQTLWRAVDPLLAAYAAEDLARAPGEVIRRFLQAFYDQYLLDTYEDYKRRLEDLQETVAYTAHFESNEAFLSDMALVTNLDAEPARADDAPPDCVRLSTVHQAKGLEWKVVFVLWLSDGMFPSGRATQTDEGEEEERRLFYVAVTRAKDELYLCAPETRRNPDGGLVFYSPSRFLGEIPPGRLRKDRDGTLS